MIIYNDIRLKDYGSNSTDSTEDREIISCRICTKDRTPWICCYCYDYIPEGSKIHNRSCRTLRQRKNVTDFRRWDL
jgi:hypothetical protein